MQLKTSAPGSLMLLGEYAALEGKPALVCAVNKRIHVTLTPRNDQKIFIRSTLHGEYETELAALTIEKPFQFVLGALKQCQPRLRRGCDIVIDSEFSDKVGLGSSAAVTVATLAAIMSWLDVKMMPIDFVRQGRLVVRAVQGVGSGADIAASVYGGIVAYQANPLQAERFAVQQPLTVLYAGFKTPTVEAIKYVQQQFAALPNLFKSITNSIGQCAVDGVQMVRKADWNKFGEIMTVQQGLLQSLGVSSPLLNEMTDILHAQPTISGAKISGSGLGDCVIGLGAIPEQAVESLKAKGVQLIPVEMTLQGVHSAKS